MRWEMSVLALYSSWETHAVQERGQDSSSGSQKWPYWKSPYQGLLPLASLLLSPGASLVALPKMQEMWFQSHCWKDPLEKAIVTHSSILAWKSHGLRSMGHKRAGHDSAAKQHYQLSPGSCDHFTDKELDLLGTDRITIKSSLLGKNESYLE